MLDPRNLKFEIPDAEKVKVGDKIRFSCVSCGEGAEVTIRDVSKCPNGCCINITFSFDCKCGMTSDTVMHFHKQTEREKENASRMQRHFNN